jgi:hypothetical protein
MISKNDQLHVFGFRVATSSPSHPASSTAALLPTSCATITELGLAATSHMQAPLIEFNYGMAFRTRLPSVSTRKRPNFLRGDVLRTGISRMRGLLTQHTYTGIAATASDLTPNMRRRTQVGGAINSWAVNAIRNWYPIFLAFTSKEDLSFQGKKANDCIGWD